MTWKAKERWLGKNPKVLLEVIEEHFDGKRFCEYQAFWNPKSKWETPIIFPNMTCSHFF
jgi:hypothetical protein